MGLVLGNPMSLMTESETGQLRILTYPIDLWVSDYDYVTKTVFIIDAFFFIPFLLCHLSSLPLSFLPPFFFAPFLLCPLSLPMHFGAEGLRFYPFLKDKKK